MDFRGLMQINELSCWVE